MAAGPAEAAKLIATVVQVDSPPRATIEVLREIILIAGWYSGPEAQERAELWLARFKKRIDYEIYTATQEGQYLHYSFNSSGNDYIQGSCHPEPGEAPERVEAKANRSNTLRIFDACTALNPTEFELLCGRVLSLLKVERAFVSRRSADQGVDFFGRVPFGDILKPSILTPGAEKHFFVWLIGQAKHYPETTVSTSEIRELVGSIEFARAKIFAGKTDPLSDLSARLCDPIIYLMFTTGKFTRDSKDIMTRSGVMSFDGLQISQFLADSNICITSGTFDTAAFLTWVRETP